jgi:glycosyltransferase involved in cell wall biosynthesis
MSYRNTLGYRMARKIETNSRHPHVSIILPTYNRAEFIVESVNSVLYQNYSNFELIVIDDGSTDETANILQTIAHPNLKIITQVNGGRSRARNAGLNLAMGEYIAFQDSDDVYLPRKLERQVAFLENFQEYGAVYTSAECIGETGESLNFTYRASISGQIYSSIAFFRPVTITLPTVMVRRSVLEEVGFFDEALERFEDTDLWRRIAKNHLFGAIEDVTCKIRTHPKNSLLVQDPKTIAATIRYYVSKVFSEDSEIRPDILNAGARRLCEHYGISMANVSAFSSIGQILLQQGRRQFSPKVSIVIPVFNGSDYLREAIDSALGQTYDNVEIIVINDGSTDGGITESIALSYGERIRYVYKHNGGVASALNRGIEEMSGELFSWLSHDDVYSPYKLAQQIAFLSEQPEPFDCVIYGDYSIFSSSLESAQLIEVPKSSPENFRYFITSQNILHGCTLLVPKRAFELNGLFSEALKTTQDYDLWFRMARTHRFIHMTTSFVFARSHENQGTQRLKDIVLWECDRLLAGFVENLTSQELYLGAAKNPAAALLEMSDNFRRRGFIQAAKRATELAYYSIYSSITLISGQELKLVKERHPNAFNNLVDLVGLAGRQLTGATPEYPDSEPREVIT